ncbi:MAG: TIM44-like domain-containing protein [Niameybacter sp.]
MKNWMLRHQSRLMQVAKLGAFVGGCVLLTAPCFADVGNNVDYSSGSSGSSGSSSASSYSIDPYTMMLLMRWIMREPWILIPIVLVLFFFYRSNQNRGGNRGNTQSTSYGREGARDFRSYEAMPQAHKGSLNQLMEADPHFSEQMLVSKVNNMFMRLQLAWMNKKWEEARPFETDALFNTHKMQLDQFIQTKRTNRIEDITILNTDILKYYTSGDYEYLDVAIKSRFVDYVVNDENGQVLKGDQFRAVHMQYIWKLVRKQGVPTNDAHVEATACPNCGANLSINQAGRCEYCDSIVTKGDFDWVLSEIEVISQHK